MIYLIWIDESIGFLHVHNFVGDYHVGFVGRYISLYFAQFELKYQNRTLFSA